MSAIFCVHCGFSGEYCDTAEGAVKSWIEKAQAWSKEPELRAERDKLKSELAEANEYARKLSVKVTEQGNEIVQLKNMLATQVAKSIPHVRALSAIAESIPCSDGAGGWFWPRFDGEGNEIGQEQVDPSALFQQMADIAAGALFDPQGHILQGAEPDKEGRDYRDGRLKGEAPALVGGGL